MWKKSKLANKFRLPKLRTFTSVEMLYLLMRTIKMDEKQKLNIRLKEDTLGMISENYRYLVPYSNSVLCWWFFVCMVSLSSTSIYGFVRPVSFPLLRGKALLFALTWFIQSFSAYSILAKKHKRGYGPTRGPRECSLKYAHHAVPSWRLKLTQLFIIHHVATVPFKTKTKWGGSFGTIAEIAAPITKENFPKTTTTP